MSQILGPQFLVSGEKATKWSARVFASDSYAGPWSWVPYLQVRSFSQTSAPEIAKATFTYEYGFVKQPNNAFIGTYTPRDLGNKFIRIELQNDFGSFIAWQGYMVDSNLDIWGESQASQGEGIQTMQAYGLEYLLTKVKVTQALAKTNVLGVPAFAAWLDWVPPFNMNMGRGTSLADVGNRSVSRSNVDLGNGNIQNVWLFQQSERSDFGAKWTAADAVETVLKVYGTRLGIPWAVNGQVELIDNWEPTHTIEGMSVWDALQSLMPKARGISFTMEHIDPPTIWLSSTFPDDIVVDTDDGILVFPGNPEVYDLDFNDALDVKQSVVFMSTQDRYREVLVTGEKARCTFTVGVKAPVNTDGELVEGWQSTDEQAYKNPDIPVPPPGADSEWYAKARDRARSSERFSRVFKYFMRDRQWNGMKLGVSTCPLVNDDGTTNSTVARLPVLSNQGFMRTLPFKNTVNYSVYPPEVNQHLGNINIADFRRTFGVIYDPTGLEVPVYRYIHDIQEGRVPNVIMRMADNEFGIELPNAGHFFALNHWQFDFTAETDKTRTYPVFNFANLKFTVQWQLDQRLKFRETISGNEEDAVLYLHVPGAHLWCVHPDTIVDIDPEGEVLTYQGPYELRNDKDILKVVASVAMGWYSTRRNLCTYTITGMFPHIPIGAMLGVGYTGGAFAQINTVVTKKLYRFDEEPTCQVMTGYSNLDIVAAATNTLAGRPRGSQGVGAGNRSAAQKGKIPSTPSNAVHIRQTHAHRERLEREEDRTQQLPATLPGGLGGGGGGGDHVHAGHPDDISFLSIERTKIANDGATENAATFGVHINAGRAYSDRSLWG